MNYIVTTRPEFFSKIGEYNYCVLTDLKDLPNEIAFDSETTGLSAVFNEMFCIQIGDRTNNYIVDLEDGFHTFEKCIPYLKGKTMVLQNALFDLGFMYKFKFVPEQVRDTMLASKILYNGDFKERHDFKTLMSRELGQVYDKTSQKNIHIVKLSRDTAIQYSFNDVDRLQELHDVLFKQIVENGQIETYLLHCRFIKALAYMEICGLPLDEEMWKDKMLEDEITAKDFEDKIGKYIYENAPQFGDTQIDLFEEFKPDTFLNLNSPKQMVPVFNFLGINTKTKEGKDSLDKSIIKKTKHEFVDLWLKYQEANHRVTTFGKSILDEIKNGRIYTNFNPMVDTSRLSSRKGHINFLNFPSDKITRDCFKAPEGHQMIVCDWSGQETVIMADQSGDKAMTKSVVEGADLHCLLAKELFPEIKELSDEEIIENHSDKRTKAKAPRFAMQYGGNGFTLHVNENIPLDEAEAIYETFLNLHKELFEWGKNNLDKAIKKGYIESVDGWRLKLPKYDWFMSLHTEINNMSKADWTKYRVGKAEYKREWAIKNANSKRKPDEEKKVFKCLYPKEYEYYKTKKTKVSDYFSLRSTYQRLALNNPIQTRGAHQMKLALSLIFEWIVENDYMHIVLMCNAVHDETVCQAPDHLAEDTRKIVEKSMLEAGDFYLDNLKIKADANKGKSWYEAK